MTPPNHYIRPEWPAPSHIRAFSSTRTQHNGMPFNLANYVDDDPDAVTSNLQTLCSDLELPESPTWLHQVHGNHAVRIEAYPHCRPEADASVTQQKNKVCAVLTADCLPVLIGNRDGTEVAAIHAGWKGLLKNVIASTIDTLQSSPDDLLAWMGPALGPQHFEIGHEIYADFLNAQIDYHRGFIRQQDRWHLDAYAIGKMQLMDAGVSAIYGGNFCTYQDSQRFFSYRRDNGVTGRMASLIYIT